MCRRMTHRQPLVPTQLWFMINASFLTASTGALGVLAARPGWSTFAIISGSVFGTLFQAFHGAQGPRMGLPQMIQSRAQFGTRGAVLPLVAATLVQFGFAIFYVQTGALSINVVTPSVPLWLLGLLVGIAALAVAIIGYQLVMRAEKLVSYLMVAALLVLSFCAFAYLPIGDYFADNHFALTAFLFQFGASATFQIAVAPVVSDYTRYLPERVSGAKVSATVFGGTLVSAIWIEFLGAVLAIAYPDASTVVAFDKLAHTASSGLAVAIMIVSSCSRASTPWPSRSTAGPSAFLTAVEAFAASPRASAAGDLHRTTGIGRNHRQPVPSRQRAERIRGVPRGPDLLPHPVDGGQPDRLLPRATRNPLHHRHSQDRRRYLRRLGLYRHDQLRRRIRLHGPVLQHHGVGRSGPPQRWVAPTSPSRWDCRCPPASTCSSRETSTARPNSSSLARSPLNTIEEPTPSARANR